MTMNKDEKMFQSVLRAVAVLKEHLPPNGLGDPKATNDYYAIFNGPASWKAHALNQIPRESNGTTTLIKSAMRQR
jgi:hypothetical protein